MTAYAYRMEPCARATDPDTSHAAADMAGDLAQQHHALILAVLEKHGPGGKCFISSFLVGIDDVAVARRLKEMNGLGLIALTGNRVQSHSGRLEREWKAV